MIVISGALVLVALVLLVLGLTMTDLEFVYGSIAVSLVSFVFLVIGILQRRGQPSPADPPPVTEGKEGRGDKDASEGAAAEDKAPAAVGAGRTTAQFVPAATTAKAGATGSQPVDDDDVDDEELEPGGGPVLVVAGRPRYHVEGCRYLTGKSPEEIDVLDAQDDGFTPCGVCKPDAVLAELYGDGYDDEDGGDDGEDVAGIDEPDDDAEFDDDDQEAEPGAADDAPALARPGRGGGSAARGPAPARPAAKPAKATPKPAKAAPKPAKAAAKPAKTSAPAKASRSAQTARTAALPVPAATVPAPPDAVATSPTASTATSTARVKVVVIPDRGRFHTPACRFVRDALGTEELTRTQAGKQGYQACGVCKP